jgi:hypothetical protein
MDVENAANILAGSILIGISVLVVVVVAVAINNLISRYWKPLGWFNAFNVPTARFATPEEVAQQKIEPTDVSPVQSKNL